MNRASYVEADCTIEHDGRRYEAGGAIVTDGWVRGYFKRDRLLRLHGVITDWHGAVLGAACIKSSWWMPLTCHISDRQYQVVAHINGIVYSGRTMGDGMAWQGRRLKRQPEVKV